MRYNKQRLQELAGIISEAQMKPEEALAVLKVAAKQRAAHGDEEVYLNAMERDEVKKIVGGRLSRAVPSATKGVRVTQLVQAASGNTDFYNDGGDFFKGDKVVLKKGKGKTVADFAKIAGIKL